MGPSTQALAWLWWGRSLPKGNQWVCWDFGLGPSAVSLPVHLPPPMHPWNPLHTPNSHWHTLHSLWSPEFPLMPPISHLAPEYLHSLLAPQYTPDTPYTLMPPWCPLMAHDTPMPPRSPNAPLCHLYPFWPQSTYTSCQLHNTPLTLTTSPDVPQRAFNSSYTS